MAYSSNGPKPFERASKVSHRHIINDAYLQEFLSNCEMPKTKDDLEGYKFNFHEILELDRNRVRRIVTIDGGSTQVAVKPNFPSSTVTFYHFGALSLKIDDIDRISNSSFIDPEGFSKIKEIERLVLVLPTRGIILKDQKSLVDSFRSSLYDFFMRRLDDGYRLMDSFTWFIYEGYNKKEVGRTIDCPHCNFRDKIYKRGMSVNFTFKCFQCGTDIYLTDIFRLHKSVDENLGVRETAPIILLIEQMILVHILFRTLKDDPGLFKETLFIKDGPLAFYMHSSKMYKPMRSLVNYLFEEYDLLLVGLEKSGMFVEHAREIDKFIPNNTALLLSDEYIYKFIYPYRENRKYIYGFKTYYGGKLIFKDVVGNIYVATLPNKKPIAKPVKSDFRYIDLILSNVARLRCGMYENSIFPVALTNKLVSLSDHPSSMILKRFAENTIEDHKQPK